MWRAHEKDSRLAIFIHVSRDKHSPMKSSPDKVEVFIIQLSVSVVPTQLIYLACQDLRLVLTWCPTSEPHPDVRHVLQIHLVHYNKKYGTFGAAADKPDGLAVIGLFVKVSCCCCCCPHNRSVATLVATAISPQTWGEIVAVIDRVQRAAEMFMGCISLWRRDTTKRVS